MTCLQQSQVKDHYQTKNHQKIVTSSCIGTFNLQKHTNTLLSVLSTPQKATSHGAGVGSGSRNAVANAWWADVGGVPAAVLFGVDVTGGTTVWVTGLD